MARAVCQITTQSTNQSPNPEITFTDFAIGDYSFAGGVSASAIYRTLLYRASYRPKLVNFVMLQELGLYDVSGGQTDVDCVTGGITGESVYFYSVTVRKSDYRESINGTCLSQAKLRFPVNPTWSDVITYSNGDVIIYNVNGGNHNYIAKNVSGNLNQEPDTSPNFWDPYDISAAERAAESGITQMLDPAWNTGTTYASGAYVTSGGSSYKSLQAANLNNNPASSPSWWTVVEPPCAMAVTLLADNVQLFS